VKLSTIMTSFLRSVWWFRGPLRSLIFLLFRRALKVKNHCYEVSVIQYDAENLEEEWWLLDVSMRGIFLVLIQL